MCSTTPSDRPNVVSLLAAACAVDPGLGEFAQQVADHQARHLVPAGAHALALALPDRARPSRPRCSPGRGSGRAGGRWPWRRPAGSPARCGRCCPTVGDTRRISSSHPIQLRPLVEQQHRPGHQGGDREQRIHRRPAPRATTRSDQRRGVAQRLRPVEQGRHEDAHRPAGGCRGRPADRPCPAPAARWRGPGGNPPAGAAPAGRTPGSAPGDLADSAVLQGQPDHRQRHLREQIGSNHVTWSATAPATAAIATAARASVAGGKATSSAWLRDLQLHLQRPQLGVQLRRGRSATAARCPAGAGRAAPAPGPVG